MQDKLLEDFVLVGGTSLALRYGHRDSEDIDLFSSKNLPPNLWNHLQTNPNRVLQYAGEFSLAYIESEIKVDIAKWNIDFVNFDTIEEIRMAHPIDIFAMKLDAICTRKTKKDFIDIYELCQHFSFHEGFIQFNNLFPYSRNSSIIFTAFGEIDLADTSKMPRMFKNYEWDFIKYELKRYAKKYFLGQ